MTAKHPLKTTKKQSKVFLADEIVTLKTTMNQREIVTQHYKWIKCH